MSRRTTDHGYEALPVVPGFRIEEEIGRGTSARVFRARQENLNRIVALKVITTLGEDGNRRALRLFREASLAGALDHPGIVRAIDAGDRDDFCWFAMELVEGRTLQQLLDESGPWPWRQAIGLGLEVLDALGHAHRRGVVHRDLKPSNILIDEQGRARVLDLGLARRETDPRLTHEGGTVGTPRFMAPEQAVNPGKVDGRADLFALGAILYRTMSGVGPFDGDTVAAVLTRLLYDEPTPLALLQPDLPPAISLVIGKVLEKNPDHRFEDAGAMALALREAARGKKPKMARKPSRARVWIGAGLAALAVGIIVFFMLRALLDRGDEPRPKLPDPPKTPAAKVQLGRVRDFVPPAHAELAPIDRARAALAASAADPSKDVAAELALTLAPLKGELEVAAAQHKAAARGVMLTTGVGPARQTMSQLEERLRGDVAGDEEQLHPALERIVTEVAQAASARFEKELRTEQEDAAEDLKRDLESLLGRPDNKHWSLSEQQDVVARALGSRLKSLEGALLTQVTTKRDEVLVRLAALPVEARRLDLDRARALIRDGHFKAARETLGTVAAAAAEGSVPGAIVEIQPLLAAIDAGETRTLAEAESCVERVLRGSAPPLDAPERDRRATDLGGTVAILRRSIADVPQIAGPVEFAGAVAKTAAEAAALRARALETLGQSVPSATAIDWRVRKRGSLGSRTVVRREGTRIEVRKVDGALETFGIEDIAASTVASVLRATGEKASPVAIALLESWDGEDDAAEVRLKTLPGEPVRDWLLGAVGAALEAAASSYATEAERAAFPEFLKARRAFAEGAYARALEIAGPLLANKRLGGSTFFRQHRAELESIAALAGSQVSRAARLRPFGGHAAVKDDGAGLVRLSWTFKDGASLEGLLLPIGAAVVPGGLKWPGQTSDRAALPEDSPALRIVFAPGTPASPVSIEIEIARSPDPVPYAAVAFGGLSLLVLGDLKQSNAFAGVPLHGLERDLVRIHAVEKGVLVHGTFADARRMLPGSGRAAALNRGESTIVRLRIDADRGEIGGAVGGDPIPLTGDRKALDEPPALDLRLPPGIVVRSLMVELLLVPKRTG